MCIYTCMIIHFFNLFFHFIVDVAENQFSLFLVLLAVAIPKLDLFISLVGAVGSSFLALVFPPVLELCTFGMEGMGTFKWKLWKNTLIFLFGLVGFVLGTYVAIQEIVLSFKADAGAN